MSEQQVEVPEGQTEESTDMVALQHASDVAADPAGPSTPIPESVAADIDDEDIGWTAQQATVAVQQAKDEEPTGGSGDPMISGAEEVQPYDSWTKAELSDEIANRNADRAEADQLAVSGNKDELIARLQDDDAAHA